MGGSASHFCNRNMRKKLLIVALAVCLLFSGTALASCKKEKGLQKFSEYSFDYFDTATTITGYAESRSAFDQIAGDILSELSEYHRLYNIYLRFDGLENLCTINELVNGEHRIVTVDRRIIDLLLYAKEMYTLTGGKMNVAMGSVLSIWHDYRTAGMNDPMQAELPPMEQLRAAAEHTDIQKLIIDEQANTITLTDPKMTLDVGAIAKGYAVEMVAQSMEKKGISGFILNVGGNVRAVGAKPDGKGWTVGIEDPLGGDDYISYLSLTGQSLVTSGSYQRYYYVDGTRYHHIIDPATLMPAEGFVSVSVLTPHSGHGDGLSTALFCMPIEDGLALIESISDTEAQWVFPDGSKRASSGWKSSTIS